MKLFQILLLAISSGLGVCQLRGEPGVEVVGGHDAPHIYPWMGAMHAKTGNTWSFFCAGTLIDPEWVLTAAHCVRYTTNPQNIKMIFSKYDLDKKTKMTRSRRVTQIKIHPKNYGLTNDVALLRIKPLGLPRINLGINEPQKNVTVVGWGRLSEGGTLSRVLQEVFVNIVPNKVCNVAYGNIDDTKLCAGEKGKDACSGDSGGPLFVSDQQTVPVYTQYGIVSYGRGCAREEFPGVYTRISSYVNWINETMREGRLAAEEADYKV